MSVEWGESLTNRPSLNLPLERGRMNVYEITWSCKMEGETPEEAMNKAGAMLQQFITTIDHEDLFVWKLVANDMSMFEYLVATSQPDERSMRNRARDLGIPWPRT